MYHKNVPHSRLKNRQQINILLDLFIPTTNLRLFNQINAIYTIFNTVKIGIFPWIALVEQFEWGKWGHILERKTGNLSANPMFQKERGKICLSLSEKGGEKVAVSVTAKVSEISDTSADGLGVTS